MEICEFVDPHRQNALGRTALHVMINNGSSDGMLKLLEMGADLNLPDHEGNMPMHTVFQMSHIVGRFNKTVDEMVSGVSKMVQSINTTYDDSVLNPIVDLMFKKLLDSPYGDQLDVNTPNHKGESIFSLVLHHNLSVAMLLLERFEISVSVSRDDTLSDRLYECLSISPSSGEPMLDAFEHTDPDELLPTYKLVRNWDEIEQMAREDPDCLMCVHNEVMIKSILNDRLVDGFQLNRYSMISPISLIIAPCHIFPNIECKNPRQPMYKYDTMYGTAKNPSIIAYPSYCLLLGSTLPTVKYNPNSGKLISYLVRQRIFFGNSLIDYVTLDGIRTMAHHGWPIPPQNTLPNPVTKYWVVKTVYLKVRTMSVFLEMKWLRNHDRVINNDTVEYMVSGLHNHLIRHVVECLYGSLVY